MALFGTKKNTKETKAAPQAEALKQNSVLNASGIAHVLKNPRITEKASLQQGMSVYTFDVAQDATKNQIMSAVRSVYKVSPRKVRVVQVPSKKTRNVRTGRTGVKSGGKKAYVYLNSGETITIA
ncbi:MAG: 50S ribosomal protein L23 [Candidatus Pacebacteria bacterium]|nr:50S ribosomal protein L23 [Candidatus Paceibacterota bacterium]